MTEESEASKAPSAPMTPEDHQEFRKRWEGRLAGGEPMQAHLFDHTTTYMLGAEGEIVLDCPCLALVGFDHAGIVRVVLTKEAGQSLRRALQDFEKTQATPLEAPRRPAVN